VKLTPLSEERIISSLTGKEDGSVFPAKIRTYGYMTVCLNTPCGPIEGNLRGSCREFLGVRYAFAGRFEYPVPVTSWEGVFDARNFGSACPQTRAYYEHLEIPERMFYHKEFRDNVSFRYDEDCLNLNIYTPLDPKNCPVIVYIHGGGFNSGANSETYLDGEAFARRGIILAAIHYRVGILGYFTHRELEEQNGHDGNFGMADQLEAIRWVKNNISAFGGDPENITLLGQSAGAISIQYLCLCDQSSGLFQRAAMMSGGGKFPDFALPRPVSSTREYWLDYMHRAGADSLEQLRQMDLLALFTGVERIKEARKDNTYNTMPVIDGYYLKAPVRELIRTLRKLDYLLGYTNHDMYTILMAIISHKYARENSAFLYFFDVDAKGDNNKAFHSSDLRYVFGTLARSHRPYDEEDARISELMTDYFSNFARSGDPNGPGLPPWKRSGSRALVISSSHPKMGYPNWWKLLCNTFLGDPK